MLVCLGCHFATGHEQDGDIAYREGRYAEALAAYRRASARATDGGIWAKVAAAATRTRDYREAVDAYHELATRVPERAAEAAEGIDRVAQAALTRGDMESVREAVLGLGVIAPDRQAGRYALALVRSNTASGNEAMRLLPAAIGAAPDQPSADSLLAEYASALKRYASCDQAIAAYRSLARRTESQDLIVPKRPEHAACALQLGLGELSATPWSAEDLFYEALAVDSASAVGRRALVGLGDARVAQGDFFGAALAYQAAIDLGGDADSVGAMAATRLNGIASAPFIPDSLTENTP